MSDDDFDEATEIALAASAANDGDPGPSPDVRRQLMAAIRAANTPAGFSFVLEEDQDAWMPHPVPGIRLKVLAINKARGYATLLLDVAPGTRFPPHHHGGAEECYVVSGSLFTCGRRLGPGDFVHADSDSDHGELWTDEGCRVILVVPPEEHLPADFVRSPSRFGR